MIAQQRLYCGIFSLALLVLTGTGSFAEETAAPAAEDQPVSDFSADAMLTGDWNGAR